MKFILNILKHVLDILSTADRETKSNRIGYNDILKKTIKLALILIVCHLIDMQLFSRFKFFKVSKRTINNWFYRLTIIKKNNKIRTIAFITWKNTAENTLLIYMNFPKYEKSIRGFTFHILIYGCSIQLDFF